MATNVYEGLFILDSNSYNRDPAKASGQISTFIEKQGGEVLVSRLWEERRLAYPIKGQRKGTYWLTYFRLDPQRLDTIRRDFQLNDSVLRSLLLKIDERIADALISHALDDGKQETGSSETDGGPEASETKVAKVADQGEDADKGEGIEKTVTESAADES